MFVRVTEAHGGKLSLRLVSSSAEHVEYAGALSAEGGEAVDVTVRVNADGQVDVSQAGAAPEWLVALTRATLRTAWRSNKTGTPWPRRLTRWRPSSQDREP
jgi:hypothetical protein